MAYFKITNAWKPISKTKQTLLQLNIGHVNDINIMKWSEKTVDTKRSVNKKTIVSQFQFQNVLIQITV